MGLGSALAISRNALEVFTTGIEVAGNNVANATTPGYIREELLLETTPSYARGTNILGTGVATGGIRQQIDQYLEKRLQGSNTDAAEAAALEGIYKQLEAEVRELGDTDLSTVLSGFLAAVNDVVNQPESLAAREIAVQAGAQLARDVVDLRARLDELRLQQSGTVDSLVAEANQLIEQIRDLNPRISKLEAAGKLESDAGSLRTQRYQALDRLAEILPITYREDPDGTIDVFTRDSYLVLGDSFQLLETSTTIDRGVPVQKVTLTGSGADVTRKGGELAGLARGRDDVLGGFVDDLDAFAAAIAFEFNRLHASGQGLGGFTSLTGASAVFDTAADLDDLGATGLPFTPVHGGFQVRVTNSATGVATTFDVAVDLDGIGNDDSLDDLVAKLDAIADLSATIGPNGRLQLAADAGYEFSFADDTSHVLAALGVNTFFTGTSSLDLAVNQVVAKDPRNLAAALGGGPSDGRNGLRLAKFHETSLAALGGLGIDAHYRHTITKLAQESSSQSTILAGRESYRTSLRSQRQQLSGVSIDEEAIKILELQRAFQAAARVISTIDELYTTLINL